jgi:hypothetical protein
LDLIGNYEGANTIHVKILTARKSISSATWTHDLDNYKFEDYCKKHQKANNTLKRYDRDMDGESVVHLFLQGIHRQEYVGIKSYVIGNDATRTDLQRAIEAFKQQIVSVHNYPRDQARNKKEFRKIGANSTTQNNKRKFDSNSNNSNKRHNYNQNWNTRNIPNNQSNTNRERNDPLYIPPNVLSQLTPIQKKMMFTGRDQLRTTTTSPGSRPPIGRVVGANNTNVSSDVSVLPNTVTDVGSVHNLPPPVNAPPVPPPSASSLFGQRRYQNNASNDQNNRSNNRNINAIETSHRRFISKTKTDTPHVTDYAGRYRFEIDSRADTTCCGKGFIPLRDTDQVCDVSGFHSSMSTLKDIPIRTCVTAFDHHNGQTYVLEVGQALWFGDTMDHSLLSPNQVRTFGHFLCLTPKQYSQGKTLHGIRTPDNVELNFKLHGCISYLPIRAPTQHEIDSCVRIVLTSEDIWDSYSSHFQSEENTFLSPNLRAIFATSSKHHRSNVSAEHLARRWGTSIEVAKHTLSNTTQRGFRNLDSNLSRRYRTRQAHLRYHFLKTNVYSDTLFSEHTSARQYTCAQLFVTDQDFAEIYPMQSKSDAPFKLDAFCKTYGLPQVLITDNALEETRGEWEKVCKQYLLTQRTVEPHSGWQNRAEIEIRELKKHFRRIMHRTRCPEVFWDYGMEYTCQIRRLMARPTLEWRSAHEVLTGDTSDCSE